MSTIKTRLRYDESVVNHIDMMSIVTKQEKLAVKFGLFEDVEVHIDSENRIFYNTRVYVRTCKDDLAGNHYMYIEFQFVPSNKYFQVKSENWSEIIEKYPPKDKYLDDTAMGKVLTFCESFHPSDFAQVNDFLVLVRTVAKQESELYLNR